MQKVAIIGSGISGISSACFLAKQGFDVTVYEQNSSPGGRARKFEVDGFNFDMGPSWYWMPDVFETFFKQFDKRPADYYQLKRLDPSYRIYYSQGEILDIPSSIDALYELFESLEPGSSHKLKIFLQEGKYKYEVGMQKLVYKPGLSLLELMDVDLLKGVPRLHVFQSMSTYIKKYFRHPKLIKLLEFPVLFLGAAPDKTPALYSLMNYADMKLGTWYPEGGMYKVIEGMVDLAKSLGVTFQFNSRVAQINVHNKLATSLTVNGQQHSFDYVVAAADYHHVEQNLLSASHRNYSEEYWQNRVLAPSCLIYYLGINKPLKNLLHHNLFFDEDFGLHAREIYDNPAWPTNPLFYVCCTSKSDAGVAPANHENVFALIPVAPGLKDTDEIRNRYFELIMNRLERLSGQPIRDSIVYNRSYAYRDFISDYNSFKGNAYGLANTLSQTANLKPSIVNRKVTNLFYAGQLTVPGPGVPPALVSGQVVANQLIHRSKKSREKLTL